MSDESEKTERIGWLCITMVVLGMLFVLNKANACALACNSCNSHESAPSICKDEFYEIDTNNSRYANNTHTCTPGARVEMVASPPAPRPGIICHCINNVQDAGAGQPALP